MAHTNEDFDFPGLNIKRGQETAIILSLLLGSRTFANLPTSPATYLITVVTDSSTNLLGATIAGGGVNKVLAVYNGSNWKVLGGISGVTVPYA